MKEEEKKELKLLDIHLSAFLAHHGIEPSLENQNGKVSFGFPANEQVYKLMNKFNCDEKVPVASFCTTLKTLRQNVNRKARHLRHREKSEKWKENDLITKYITYPQKKQSERNA